MATNCCGRNWFIDDILGVIRQSDDCTPICLSISDAADLPNPATDCTFAQVRYYNGTGEFISLSVWNPDINNWEAVATITTTDTGGLIGSADYDLTGSWRADIGEYNVSGAGFIDFGPDKSSLEVTFIDGSCTYVMDTIYPAATLVLGYNDIINVPVADPSDVDQWNAYFLSGGSYANYISVAVVGNDVTLTSYVGVTTLWVIFGDLNLISVTDNGIFENVTIYFITLCPSLTFAGSSSLITVNQLISYCDLLIGVNFPLLEEVDTIFVDCFAITYASFPALLIMNGGQNFNQCGALNTIEMPVLTQLGNTVGDDSVFASMGVGSLALTLPTALATVNAGSPDGDITFAISNYGATITYV